MKKVLKWVMWILLSTIGLVLIVVIPIGINQGYERIRASFLTEREEYLEDIDRLEYLMKNEFAGYGVLPGTSTFDLLVSQLKADANNNSIKSQTAFNLAIIEAVAAFKDPHTSVFNHHVFLDSRFPYYLNWSDGSFYLLSGQVDKKWLGAEVTHIGKATSSEVFNKLSAYTNAPNDAGTAIFISSFLYAADALHEKGIIDDRDQVDLKVQLNGESATLSFNSMSRAEFAALADYYRISEQFEPEEWPLFKTNSGQNYWYKYLQEDDLFYLRYSMCVAQGDIETFWDEVFDELERTDPSKFVIDLRGNPGGDTQNHRSFLKRLAANPKLNQYGKLFVLTDRGTGSAAVACASDLQKMTASILVGEKTMDKPNTTSDPTFFTLPHSQVTLLVPSLYSLHALVDDSRDGITPHIPIVQSLKRDNYIQDQVLDSIRQLTIEPSDLQAASLPVAWLGQYQFNPVRNITFYQQDSTVYLTIDGLAKMPVYQSDTLFFTSNREITFTSPESAGQPLVINVYGQSRELRQLPENKTSLEQSILDRQFKVTDKLLADIQKHGKLPYYLDRPFFQTHVYILYNEHGFDAAMALNQIAKTYYPNDPVLSIVDFELYQYDNRTFGQVKSVFPIIGKLLKRYFDVITSDKIMNDDYNAFIGK